MSKPHTRRVFHTDLDNTMDLNCCIGELDWPELTIAQRMACKQDDMVPIFDAETTLVALVPRASAEVILEMINRFQPDALTEEEYAMIDAGGSLDQIDRKKI